MIQITDARKPKLRSFSSLRAKEFFIFGEKIYQKTQSEFRCAGHGIANAYCLTIGEPTWFMKNTEVEVPNFTLTIG